MRFHGQETVRLSVSGKTYAYLKVECPNLFRGIRMEVNTMRKSKECAVCPSLIANIVSLIQSASASQMQDGLAWYQDANDEARFYAEHYNLSITQVVGVIAALSPQKQWYTNLKIARKVMGAFTAGKGVPSVHFKSQMNKVRKILHTPDITEIEMMNVVYGKAGDKTASFAHNILHPDQAGVVTVDGHAVNAADHGMVRKAITSAATPTGRKYRMYSAVYAAAAEIMGMLPHQAQAVAWVTYRDIARY